MGNTGRNESIVAGVNDPGTLKVDIERNCPVYSKSDFLGRSGFARAQRSARWRRPPPPPPPPWLPICQARAASRMP
jgi:hypothetical protein